MTEAPGGHLLRSHWLDSILSSHDWKWSSGPLLQWKPTCAQLSITYGPPMELDGVHKPHGVQLKLALEKIGCRCYYFTKEESFCYRCVRNPGDVPRAVSWCWHFRRELSSFQQPHKQLFNEVAPGGFRIEARDQQNCLGRQSQIFHLRNSLIYIIWASRKVGLIKWTPMYSLNIV